MFPVVDASRPGKAKKKIKPNGAEPCQAALNKFRQQRACCIMDSTGRRIAHIAIHSLQQEPVLLSLLF